jgi:hypothetical protein
LPLDVARVHAVQISREQGRLVTAGARANLDDGVALVERVLRNDERLELGLELGGRLLEAFDLVAGLGGQLGVVNRNELARLRELVLLLPKPRSQIYERGESAMFTAQLGQLLSVPERFRCRERAFNLFCPRERLGEAVAKTQLCFPYFVRNRSTRPAVSISFCLPVKKGWQTLQMSV